MHRVQMTKQTRLSTILQMALDSAINALDCEDQFQTTSLRNEKTLYTECLDHYGSACIHIENALKSGQFDTVQQNALLGCMETYQFRLGGLRSWYAASYSDQDRELVLSSRTRENLKVHRKEEPLLKDTILNSCLKKVTSKWSEIAGLDKVKESLQEGFIIPLRYPELFKGIISPASNVLLYGPPGSGKTLLAEAIAGESGFNLLSVTPSALLSKWCGQSERMIKDLFDLAKKIKPSIIFFDETDAFGLSRTSGDDISSRRILTEILVQMNQVSTSDKVHIVGATNRIQDVDEALKRRFDLRIEVPLPDQCTRTMIVRLYMSQTYAELSEADYRRISDETEGYSGSDLKSVCRIAAMQPVKEFMRSLDIKMLDTVDVTKLKRQIRSCSIADFQNALTLYLPHGSTGNTPRQRSGLL